MMYRPDSPDNSFVVTGPLTYRAAKPATADTT